MDYFGFKVVFSSIVVLEMVIVSTIYFIAQYEAMYFIWVCFMFSIQGGIASTVTGIMGKNFGPHVGGSLISAITLIFGASGLICFFIQSNFIEQIGYLTMFLFQTAASVIALVITLLYPTRNKWAVYHDFSEDHVLRKALLSKEG